MEAIIVLLLGLAVTVFGPLYIGLYAIRKETYLLIRSKPTGETAIVAGYIILSGVVVFLIGLLISLTIRENIFLLLGFIIEGFIIDTAEKHVSPRTRSSPNFIDIWIDNLYYSWKKRLNK